jgi:hypothetical protein
VKNVAALLKRDFFMFTTSMDKKTTTVKVTFAFYVWDATPRHHVMAT